MIFRLAQKKDAWQIAEIHQQEIKKGFLSTLNNNFLTKIYSAIIGSKYSFCVIAEKDQKIRGFIAGVTDFNSFYLYFLKRYFFSAIVLIFPKIFNFKNIKKIFEVLFYPQKEENLPEAELLSMALSKDFQGKGIAGLMFNKFISEMKNRKINSFKVLVGSSLSPAIRFYEKNGFKFLKETRVHENVSRIYIYQLK